MADWQEKVQMFDWYLITAESRYSYWGGLFGCNSLLRLVVNLHNKFKRIMPKNQSTS